jgi:hypothetical protein
MVVDIPQADFAWHEIHRRLLDVADQQLVHDHLTIDYGINSSDIAVLTANGYRRGERTGGHNDCDGKPGRFQRLECSNQYDDISRQPGGWRQLERSNRHDDLDGNSAGWRQLERSNRHDDLDGNPGGWRQLERSNRHDDFDGNSGGCGQFKRPNRHNNLDGDPGRIGQFECADDNGNDLRDNGGQYRDEPDRRDHAHTFVAGSTGFDFYVYKRQHRRRRFRLRQFVRADIDLIFGEFE